MDNGSTNTDGLTFEQPVMQEENVEQPFPAQAPKKQKNVWMFAAIVALALFVGATVMAALFYAKSIDTKETDALNKTISDKDSEIAKAKEEKTLLEEQIEALKTEVTSLRDAAKSNSTKPATKPVDITNSEIIDASKKLNHELAAGYKVMMSSDFQYVVVEGIELSTGAGMYIYKSNIASSEWKFLLATQSVLSCEEASTETKMVLKGIVNCETSDGSYETF